MNIDEKLIAIAENQQNVYDAGIEQGKQSAYDEFWNSYQRNGNETNYSRRFEGYYWNDNTFKPKYSVNNAQNCNYMFRYSNIKDLSSLNIGYCTGAYALCREAALELMGNIYLAGNTSISQGFYSCSKLTKIGVLRVGAGTNLELAFYNCTALKEVTFTGTIGTSLGIGDSPLNRASIESIISCLSDTATGKTLTLKKSAVVNAFPWSFVVSAGAHPAQVAHIVGTDEFFSICASDYILIDSQVDDCAFIRFADVCVLLRKVGTNDRDMEVVKYGDQYFLEPEYREYKNEWATLTATKKNWSISLV